MNAPTTIILFAHGSAVPEANRAIADLAQEVSRRARCPAGCAFLEIEQPDLPVAVAQAVRAGAGRIVIIPYFLTLGVHMRQDLPRLVEQQRQRFPGTEILVGQSLDNHPRMVEVILDRVQEVSGEGEEATGTTG